MSIMLSALFLFLSVLCYASASQCGCSPTAGCVFVTCANANTTSLAATASTLKTLVGNMTVNSGGEVSFPVLVDITGNVMVLNNFNLTSLSLPVLRSVDGFFQILQTTALASLSLPLLSSVRGYFYLGTNSALASLSLPQLSSVDGFFQILQHIALASLSLPVLSSVNDDFYFSNNPLLASLSLPLLSSFGGFSVISNENLTSLSLPVLNSVDGYFEVIYNDVLSGVSFHSLLNVTSTLAWYFNGPVKDIVSFCPLAVAEPNLQLNSANDVYPFHSAANWRAFGKACLAE